MDITSGSIRSVLAETEQLPVDPSSPLHIHLDPTYKSLTPSNWAYTLLGAIRAGDLRLVKSELAAPSRGFTIDLLTEPLGPMRQTLLHVAALVNQGGILVELLRAADTYAHGHAEEQRLEVRKDALANKGGEANIVAYQTNLGFNLDKVERLYHIKCEEQYLALLNATDADNRTVLHYAAASRGTSTMDALSFNSNRFFVSRSSEYAPGAPFILFPGDGWVCRRTGDLWQPVYYEFPEDHPPQSPPDSYVSVKEILRARSDPSFSDPRDVHGASPLHYASVTGDVRSIRALLERGADPFAVTALNASTLDLASSRVVRVALMPMENAVQISCGLKMQRAGMASTSSTARSPLVKKSTGRVYGEGAGEEDLSGTRKRAADKALLALLGYGEDINLRSGIKMQAPLHLAAEKAALDIVEILLQNGALVDISDVDGRTPMHYAAELGTDAHKLVVKLLFDNGGNIDATSSLRKTPLHMAASGGPFFEHGQRLYDTAPWEKTAEEAAAASAAATAGAGDEDGDGEGVEGEGRETLRRGAPLPTLPNGGTGDGNTSMIDLLMELGANIDAQDLEGCTPLITAARRGNHLGVQRLLMHRCSLYSVNMQGQTALHVAAGEGYTTVCRQLVRWDCEVGKLKFTLDHSGRSAYDVATTGSTRESLHTLFEVAASGRQDLVQSVARQTALLPERAANPWLPVRVWESTRIMGRTPLHALSTGCAKAMAQLRKEMSIERERGLKPVAAAAGGGGMGGDRIIHAMAKAVAQRKEREESVGTALGTGLPPHKIAPSAVHIIGGLGHRFVMEHSRDRAAGGALVPAEYREWGGDWCDVLLTFPVVRDPEIKEFTIDSYAFVPKPGAHKAFYPSAAAMGDASRSAAAAARVVPGAELTSAPLEKEFGRCVDFLCKAGVDVNAGDKDGVTALHLAARYGLLFIIRRLLARGADPTALDNAGNNAVHWARAFQQSVAADILTEAHPELAEATNTVGFKPKDVLGKGLLIVPYSHERDVLVPKQLKKSIGLAVSTVL